jgi:hypothetical protein
MMMLQTVVDAVWALVDDNCTASHVTADRFVMRLAIYFPIWDMLCLSRPVQVPLVLKIVVQPCDFALHSLSTTRKQSQLWKMLDLHGVYALQCVSVSMQVWILLDERCILISPSTLGLHKR